MSSLTLTLERTHVVDAPREEPAQSKLETILARKEIPERDKGFFHLRFTQMRIDPETMSEEVLGLHIDTIRSMFQAHSEDPYDDDIDD